MQPLPPRAGSTFPPHSVRDIQRNDMVFNQSQHILVATDFSSASEAALRKASELALEVGSAVTLCHVLDPSPLGHVAGRQSAAQPDEAETKAAGAEAAASKVAAEGAEAADSPPDVPSGEVEAAIHGALEKAIARFFADVKKTKAALILSSNAADGICNYARKEQVDLIVVATHGRTGLAHLLIGSVAEKVVRHAPCPVLSVRSTN